MIAVAGVVIWLPARAIDLDQAPPSAGRGDVPPQPEPVGSGSGTGRDRDELAVVLDRSD
jgi:hypothetical protein